MSKKKLNTTMVLNELSGQSVYFQRESPKVKSQGSKTGAKDNVNNPRPNADTVDGSKVSTSHDDMPPSNHDTTVSRQHDTTTEIVRRAVKEIGKEAATHRFTPDEKRAIADLVYIYKRQGMRTSENEITRVAVNFILQDHSENGENSIIDRVLKALNE